MPTPVDTNFVPRAATAFVMEDTDGRGGFVVVADAAALIGIPAVRRKSGMLACVQADTVPNSVYQLQADLTTWLPFSAGSSAGGAATVKTIYARSSGDDASGNGTLASPYRTCARALRDVQLFANNLYQVVDITGIGVETLADTLHAPAVLSNAHVTLDPAPVFGAFATVAALTIRAVPSTVETIPSGFSVAADPVTSIATITVPGAAWTANEHAGRMLFWSGFGLSTIVSNGANTLVVATEGPFIDTGVDVYIVEQSAELHLDTQVGGSYISTIQFSGTLCGAMLCGVKVTRTNPVDGATNQSVTFAAVEDFLAYGCWFEGVDLNFAATTPLFVGCYFKQQNVAERFALSGSGFSAIDCAWSNIVCEWTNQGNAAPGVFIQSCVFDGCSPVGHGTSFGTSIVAFVISKTLIQNGQSHGVQYDGGALCSLSAVEISNAVGSAVVASGPGRLVLQTVTGSGNAGFGLLARYGAFLSIDDSVTVSGVGGDIKTGGMAVRTFANYRSIAPIRRQADFFDPNTSDGSVVAG